MIAKSEESEDLNSIVEKYRFAESALTPSPAQPRQLAESCLKNPEQAIQRTRQAEELPNCAAVTSRQAAKLSFRGLVYSPLSASSMLVLLQRPSSFIQIQPNLHRFESLLWISTPTPQGVPSPGASSATYILQIGNLKTESGGLFEA